MRWTFFWRSLILNGYFRHICWRFSQTFATLLSNKSKSIFACFYKILSVTLLKGPIAAILTLKMQTGSRKLSVKSYRKPPVTSKFWCIFTAVCEGSILEKMKKILRRVPVSISKITKSFHRSKWKVYICITQQKAFGNQQCIPIYKVLIKTLRPSKKYPSRDIVPLILMWQRIM